LTDYNLQFAWRKSEKKGKKNGTKKGEGKISAGGNPPMGIRRKGGEK